MYSNAADESDQNSGVIALGTLYDYSISSRLDLIFDYQIQFVEENSGKRNSHLKTGLEFEFRDDFSLDFTLYIDRVAQSITPTRSLPPESNDYRLILSLGYDF